MNHNTSVFRPPHPSLPRLIAHADWGTGNSKRQTTLAVRDDGYYYLLPTGPVGDLDQFLPRLKEFAGTGETAVLGLDFPIGLPATFAAAAGIGDFLDVLPRFGTGEWTEFYEVAETAEQISVRRPFYPKRPGGSSHEHLVQGLGLHSVDELYRFCERSTPDRGAASPLFWTLGAKQVGKAALSGWRDLLAPGLAEYGINFAIWPFLLPVLALHIVIVSRLRKDACLFDLRPAGSHGNRIYGKNKISLAKRAGHQAGWQTITYHSRSAEVTRQYKTFLATFPLVRGQIRVVILRFEDGSWAPYFCTDTLAEVRDILEAIAARWAIEEHFHDVKEVWGLGQQQVRNVWSNIGCWHLNQWVYTLVELCCWDLPQGELSDRRERSWDNPDRRPSHADRRRCISREMLEQQFLAVLPNTPDRRKFRSLIASLLSLCL